MQTEIEVKFLNVNHDELRERLKACGAAMEQPMRRMRRINMDFPDRRLQQRQGWLRIRDEGNRVTVTYKQLHEWSVDGVQEAETVVGDFEAAKAIFEAIGLETKSFQETARETWQLDGVEVVLDRWPHTRPYCELEGADKTSLQKVASLLGFAWEDAVFGSVEPVYRAEYDITDEEFYKLTELTLEGELPELLQQRRRPEPVRPVQEPQL